MYGRQSNLPHRREQRVPLLGGGAPPAGFGGGAGSADDSVRGGRGHVQAARCHTGEIHPGEEIQCADGRAHCGRVAEMSKSDTGVTESGIICKEFRGFHGNPAQVLGYGGARKKIEEDKNEFFDFVQTELMPSIDVSMVVAITKLHETVDKFEPAFDKVINRFQNTFDRCTKAFGEDFEKHVNAVSNAVEVMGENMDKINQNIRLQEMLLSTLKSNEIVRGLDRYVEAANHFIGITKSLDKFEEARRMMLAAAQEAIVIQNKYNDSLRLPREVAPKVNSILVRITNFEQSINDVGESLANRHVLGNQVIEAIQRQVQGISKKGKIADKFLEMADGKLEDLFRRQTEVLESMNDRYKDAIEGHIEGFENMIKAQTSQLESQHEEFITAIKEKFNIEDIREEFTNLRKLEIIEKRLSEIIGGIVSPNNVEDIQKEIKSVETQLQDLKVELEAINKNTRDKESNGGGGFFGFGRR